MPDSFPRPFPAQAELLARLQSDYAQALKHPTLLPFMGHEEQWGMVRRFTPESYRCGKHEWTSMLSMLS